MEIFEDDFTKDYRIPFKNTEQWKNYLKKNGFVVISEYLSKEKSAAYYDQMLLVLEILSQNKFKKDDLKTWTKSSNLPYMPHGMIQYIGHSQFQWDLREDCSDIFSKLWDTSKTDLATSFDGFYFMSGERKYKSKADNSFLHTDQSPIINKLWSYQGLINLLDCPLEGGGFVCIPQSHLMQREYFEKRYNLSDKKFKENWYKFTNEEKEKEELLKNVVKVNCKSGDFILWDSRTFHCNRPPTGNISRACTYICMLPKSHVPEEKKAKRAKAFSEKRCTNHHSGEGFKIFSKLPRFCYPKILKPLLEKVQKKIKITKLQVSLAYYK
jgi:hypothetical protein